MDARLNKLLGALPVNRVLNTAHTVRTLAGTGIVRLERPDTVLRTGVALARWGPTPAAGYTASAIRMPDAVALHDETGELSFRQVHERSNAIARGLAANGVKEGDAVGILCRNHRGFILATVACSKLGAHALYLNTAFAGPQITDVCEREKPIALIYDQEFSELCADAAKHRKVFVAWYDDDDGQLDGHTLDELCSQNSSDDVKPPSERGRVVILTSGTTGTPKGASRKQPDTLDPAAALFSKIPLKAREQTVIAAPMFHSWGFAHFTLGLALSSTLIVRRKFDPEHTLEDVSGHGASALAVVPVMLSRIMELGEQKLGEYDLSSLRVIAASGSALPGELATKVMDAFGDVLYNLYGSTEVAWATIATPADLRAAPGTAGRPPRGTVVKLYDTDGQEVPAGETGRIFVANEMLFEGYAGGGKKDLIDGLMSTGDVGHFDEAGRLFVAGRDDDMIVSGGENVFPREVEDLLSGHEAIDEAAVIGIDDEKFGQRLKAFVVVRQGAQLSEEDVKAHVKGHLARYKVPREVVLLDELPRNATGKVLKRELREQ
ncbi:MAG: acyl-CoA synthetase [Solirubrobacteraceae bacterium]